MAEYIEREAAKKACAESETIPRYSENNHPVTDKILDSLPAVSVQQWISVKDKLPNVNRTGSGYEEITVIATDGESVRPMIYERACIRGKTKYRWKWIWDRIYDGKPIVAWMPLPKPPKGENDG